MLVAVSYGVGACAFLALIVLMLARQRPQGLGLPVLLACMLTAVWAAAAAIQIWWMPGVAHALESLRSGAWLFALAAILFQTREGNTRIPAWAPLPTVAVALGLLSAANDLRFVTSTPGLFAFSSSQVLARIVIAVCGLLVVENLLRNTPTNRRWHVTPLCIAIGGLFAYDLFVFSEVVILQRFDPLLLAGRGVVLVFAVPMLALTMARNPDWRIDIHISRRVVFHTATLFATGVFLVLAAGVAALIGRIHGDWARLSEIAFFCGSVAVLFIVLSTESIRARLRRVISENFFSTRYDYRTEWTRCIVTLSSVVNGEPLSLRAIRALADVVDSPGGALWLQRAEGGFGIEQVLNMKIDISAVEPVGSKFLEGFRGGEAVQQFSGVTAPAWAERESGIWLAVPLLKIDQLIGFVVLSSPRAPIALNWESDAVLLAIGQQAAGYLVEERATRTLLESRALIDYSTKFSFVVHDIKNVCGQLGMSVANIQKFGDLPEFRADLVRSMQASIKKLDGLLDKIRPEMGEREVPEVVDPREAVLEVVREINGHNNTVRTAVAEAGGRVRIVPSDLNAILVHLVTNAIEASAPGEPVVVFLGRQERKVVIEIRDRGCGMSKDFMRDNLFVPLFSTKGRGHGMGAYQARALVRASNGDLEVMSVVGRGTTIRIMFPDAAIGLDVGRPSRTVAS